MEFQDRKHIEDMFQKTIAEFQMVDDVPKMVGERLASLQDKSQSERYIVLAALHHSQGNYGLTKKYLKKAQEDP